MAIVPNAQDCASDRLNLGMPSCLAELKDYKGFIAVPKNWSLGIADDTFDLDYVVGQIQQGNFIPFLGANEFVDNTPDPTNKEFTSGITMVIRNGLPTYQFEFNKEYAFHKAASSFNSFRQYDILIVDSVGNIFAAENTDGTEIEGFKGGMINTRTFRPNDGGAELAKTLVDIQLINERQYNRKGVVLTASSNGFSALDDLFAIMDVTIDGAAEAGGDLVFKVKSVANPAFDVEGALADNFRLTVDGVAAIIDSVSYNESTYEYSLTPDTPFVSNEELVLEFYDSVESINVANIDNMLIKGSSGTITVS